ncbi:hypothetical protein PAHAL_2G161200 [Panicum hallii]|uniref:Uncharacterized protein n=1 Tax=Panicum hallii TaxID=206008 RepID=A0A2T8KPA2_9POAL|nr:hypothetical protein PAHAL_2G161200 [Panicum hallii]
MFLPRLVFRGRGGDQSSGSGRGSGPRPAPLPSLDRTRVLVFTLAVSRVDGNLNQSLSSLLGCNSCLRVEERNDQDGSLCIFFRASLVELQLILILCGS